MTRITDVKRTTFQDLSSSGFIVHSSGFIVSTDKTPITTRLPLGGGINSIIFGYPYGNNIYIGTGSCCGGHLLKYELDERDNKVRLEDAYGIDFNVHDILPIYEHGALVSGAGCSGNGVRHIDFIKRRISDIIPTTDMSSDLDMRTFKLTDNRIYVLADKNRFALGCYGHNGPADTVATDITDTLTDKGIDTAAIIKSLRERCSRKNRYDLFYEDKHQ